MNVSHSSRRCQSRFFCLWLVLALLFTLSGCVSLSGSGYSVHSRDGAPSRDVDVSAIPDAVPRIEKVTKAGNRSPYKVLGKTYHINFNPQIDYTETGYASWYGTKFHGNQTANGEVYDMYAMTAAHKTLPIPSYVRVTNLENNRSVTVRINDRGPFHDGRIVDLSYVAAKKLDILRKGTAPVRLEVLRVSTSVPTHAAAGDLYLQVGAFKQHASAVRLKTRAGRATRYPAQVHHEPEQGLYKVLIGPIDSEHALPQIRKMLAVEDITQTYLVQR